MTWAILSRPEGNVLATIPSPQGKVRCLALSPDGAFLSAGCEDGAVRIWDVSDLE